MDALDVATLALRLALVVVLYLFLFAVLREARAGLERAEEQPNSGRSDGRAAPAPLLRLAVIDPGAADLQPGALVDVPSGATCGRGASATVRLVDPTVSGEHARFGRTGKGWVIADLGSTNGTAVNGVPADGPTPIGPGDVITLGNVRLRVATA